MFRHNNRIMAFLTNSSIWVCFLFLAFFSVSSGINNIPKQRNPNTLNPEELQKIAQVERQITSAATQNFNSSLEMKENIDFLLTPALLVQEAMSDEILITYPTE